MKQLDHQKTGLPSVSIIVPVNNEDGSLPMLLDEIAATFSDDKFECIVVDDGSTDTTATVVSSLMNKNQPWLRLLQHDVSYGKSAAIRSGLHASNNNIIGLIDGDGENDPVDLKRCIAQLSESPQSIGLINGRRLNRKHSIVKRFSSAFANKLRAHLLGDGMLDSASGIKALRREVFLRIPYFNNWHRFFPALVKIEGFGVSEIDISDRARSSGSSHYGIVDRALAGVIDLPAVYWLKLRGYGHVNFTEVMKNKKLMPPK